VLWCASKRRRAAETLLPDDEPSDTRWIWSSCSSASSASQTLPHKAAERRSHTGPRHRTVTWHSAPPMLAMACPSTCATSPLRWSAFLHQENALFLCVSSAQQATPPPLQP